MTRSLSPLAAAIREEIRAGGPISFARYMELALYAPGCGYYRRGADPFGCCGDFYTAAQLQPVFGETIAEFVRANNGTGADSAVCELGAGRRELSAALAQWNYIGIDYDGAALPHRLTGLVIANEFFDALPVNLLKRTRLGWVEMRVDWNNGLRFVEASAGEAQLRYAEVYGRTIPIFGYLERNEGLEKWLTRIASMLCSGRLLVIDYGYSSEELRRFPSGSLMTYRQHTAASDVLLEPGERDITAHVNFSELRAKAVECGFDIESETTLQQWMLSIWSEEKLQARWAEAGLRWRMQWKKLAFEMGGTFRVLTFKRSNKGIASRPQNKNAPENLGGASN